MRRLFATASLAFGVLATTVGPARASVDVPVVSSDSQATVYSRADYTKPFDVVYDVRLDREPHNASWWLVNLYLLGLVDGGGEAEVGVARGFPNANSIEFYTSSKTPGGTSAYVSEPGVCGAHCRIELRGDATSIDAFANGRRIRRWSRAALGIRKPYLQLNAEAHGKNDVLAGSMRPVRATVGGAPAPTPECALTTRGMDTRRLADGTLTFFGRYDARAEPSFFDLSSRATGPDCDALRAEVKSG